jgi:hypothetical protein
MSLFARPVRLAGMPMRASAAGIRSAALTLVALALKRALIPKHGEDAVG